MRIRSWCSTAASSPARAPTRSSSRRARRMRRSSNRRPSRERRRHEHEPTRACRAAPGWLRDARSDGRDDGPAAEGEELQGAARRLLGLLAPHRGLVIAVLACCAVAVAFTVSGPKMLGRATDIIFKGFLGTHPAGANPGALARVMHVQVGRGIDFGELVQVLALVMALYAGAVVFMWLQGYILTHLVQRVVNRLRADVDAKLMRVPLEYFDRQPRGEVLSRVTNDIENVAMGLQQTMSQIMTATLTVLGVLVMLVVISPLLAVVALVTVPLSIVITAKIGQRAQKSFAAQWKHVGALNGQIEEAFTGHALVKVFGRRRQVEERFRAKNDELYEAGFRAQFVSSLIMPAITFVGNLNYVAIAVVGGLRVASGAMLLGSVQAFIQYSRQFTQNLSQLAQVANVLQSGVASAERVFELLDEPEQSLDRSAAELPAAPRGEVRFDDVSFRYQADLPLIEHLSLVAQPGQTIAIVGPTGAGKTTLVNLLMRFYDLKGGAIRIDGVDIASVPRREVRRRLGMVLQDTWLFGGTIRDNIRYGHPTATEEEMLGAATATYVDRFVRALPGGYDTVIDEESSNL